MCIANFQPIICGELSSFFGKEVSCDLIGVLRAQELIASGPRCPQPGGALYLCDDQNFSVAVRMLRQLADFEALEDAGLLSKEKLLAGDIMPFGWRHDDFENSDRWLLYSPGFAHDRIVSKWWRYSADDFAMAVVNISMQ